MEKIKLYTEEQVREVFDLVKLSIWGNNVYTKDELIGKLTPIELPSDEEIEKKANKFKFELNKTFFKEGAKWILEQIKQQDK